MNPNKALWEKGDFTQIAATMRESGEAVARSLGVVPGMRVLDLGCGDGTTALPLAQMGAHVTGIDVASNLVEAGNKRAAEAGLKNLKFEEGDACHLDGVADNSFDLTLSVFGAMFAPKPSDVAKEMVRVTKRGGRIVMGNWIPGDPTFVAQLLKISSAYTPPPPEGFLSPMMWGVESHIVERFEQAGVPKEQISLKEDTFLFVSPDQGPEQVIEAFRRFYGPTMNAYDAADKNNKVEELHRELVELAKAKNASGNGGTRIPATFMRVEVRV
jgi:ubiquinone/menaquinone biosynthesis C-methylase UbiE